MKRAKLHSCLIDESYHNFYQVSNPGIEIKGNQIHHFGSLGPITCKNFDNDTLWINSHPAINVSESLNVIKNFYIDKFTLIGKESWLAFTEVLGPLTLNEEI